MELKKVMLTLGIGILAALFLGFLIEAIYSSPEYDDYCQLRGGNYIPKASFSQDQCEVIENYSQSNECQQNGGFMESQYDETGCAVSFECNYCSKNFDVAKENYNKILFYVTAPIALLLIVLGLYLPISIDAIAAGALFAGILTLIQITIRVFADLGKWPRVILLGLELLIVVWIGIKRVYHMDLFTQKKKK